MNRACIRFPSCAEGWSRRRPTLAPSIPDHSLKLSAARPLVSLEITLWPDYDRPRASSVCRGGLSVRGRSEFLTERKRGGNDDRLFRSGIRHGGEPVRRHRQSSVDSDGRTRPPAAAET